MIATVEKSRRKVSTNAFIRLVKEIGGYGSWHRNPEIQLQLSRQLKRFNEEHEDSVQHIDRVMHGVARGNSLLKAVRKWEEPFVGSVPTTCSSSSVYRGIQWRLVLAYNAFEIVYVSLFIPKKAKKFRENIDTFLSSIPLESDCPAINPPNKERAALQQWLEQAMEPFESIEDRNEGEDLLNFLGLRSGDRRVFRTWVVEEQPVDSWAGAIEMAKAIRNMSAHGSLSATKVKDLGLREAIEMLTENLGIITCGAISVLLD